MEKTILIVDDEPGYRDLLGMKLGDNGFRVLTAGDGFEAEDVLRREVVDLVVTDMKMPRMDGLDVLHAAKTLRRDLPVVLITGYALEQRSEAALEHAAAFLRKPFYISELLSVLKVNMP